MASKLKTTSSNSNIKHSASTGIGTNNSKTFAQSVVASSPPGMKKISNPLASIESSENHSDNYIGNFIQIGSNVQLQTNDGNVFEGIFHTATPFKNQKYQYAMKNTQVVMDKTNCNVKKGTTLLVPYDSILSVSVVDLDLSTKGSNADLQIDDVVRNKSISHLEGRDLEAVSSSWVSSHVNASLEGDNSKTEWNQFETNARLFNVKSTYDENLYTKKLDMSTVTKDKLAEAERLAREIESSTTSDIHLQEERGQVLQREIDEETLYSGVVRENSVSPNTNKKVLSAANSDVWKRAAKPSPTTTNAQTSSSSSPNKPKESVWNKMKPETKAVSETTDVLVKTVLDNASTPMPLIQQKEDVTPKVPETSNSSDDNHESSNQISPPIKSTLKATATEWKPNVDAKEFVPPGDLDNSGPSFDNPLDMMPQIPMQVMPGYPFQQFQQMMPTQMMAPIDVSMYGYDQAMMMPPGPFMQQGGFIHMAPPMGMGVPDAAMMGYPGYPGAYGNAFGGPMHMLPQHSPYVGRGQGNMGPSDGRNGRYNSGRGRGKYNNYQGNNNRFNRQDQANTPITDDSSATYVPTNDNIPSEQQTTDNVEE